MAQVVTNGTPFSGTVDTVPPLPIVGSITVATDKMSALSTEVALESDVNDSLTTLFPAFPYISGAFVVGPGTLKYSAIDSIELATKTTKGGTAVVLEGELKFTLDVLLPAQDPTPKPDTNTSYIATVTLSPTHSKFTSA